MLAMVMLAATLNLGCGDSDGAASATSIKDHAEKPAGEAAQPESEIVQAVADTTQHIVDRAGIKPAQNQAYWAKLPTAFAAMSSDGEASSRSRLVLFEDDKVLGPRNAPHSEIRDQGHGAYSHWQSGLYFSSSDGTDPRTNGRTYLFVDVVAGWTSIRIPSGALRWTLDTQLIVPRDGLAWRAGAPPEWSEFASNSAQPYRSRMVLLENGRPLSQSNATHASIRAEGGGSFSHWGQSVLFSTSDNSDPRSNGYQYEAVLSDVMHSRAYRVPSRPVVAESIGTRETLAAPQWVLPDHEGALLGLTPTFEAVHERDDVLFYFEIDTSEGFDSRNLLRWPRLAEGPDGPNPLIVLDPEADGRPHYQPPFRLSAMTLEREASEDELLVQAHRLVYGLPVGFTQVNEVVRFAAQQIYPFQSMSGRVPAAHVLAVDHGTCGSINGLIQSMLDCVGYETRLVAAQVPRFTALAESDGLGGHTGLEVYWDDAWRYVDGYYDVLSWGSDLASLLGREATLDEVFVYAPMGVLANEDESFRRVTLADYAGHVRYQHDAYAPSVTADDYVDPIPPGALDPSLDFRTLWPENVLTLYARVRVVRADPAHLQHLFPGRPPELRFEASELEVSPWVTWSFGIDLSRLPQH
jgi:hypothetical protein